MNWKKKVRIFQNNIEALASYQRKRVKLRTLPSYLWIEPTNDCNLKCIMCPNGAGKVYVERGYMEIGLFKKIIDDVCFHTSTVVLAMSGESLLHPDIFKMIGYAEKHQIKISLNTNATLLDREKAQNLLDSGISYISFAFDGFNKSQYEKIRRGADFDETLENILYFLRKKKEGKKRKPYAVLSMLEMSLEDAAWEEKEVFLRNFENLIDDIHIREVNSWGSVFKDSNNFKTRRFCDNLVVCGRIWNSLGIAWNGNVVPCTYNMNHEYLLGNIREESLAKIWNSSKFIQLRQAMIDGSYLDILPLCENCTIMGTPKILGIPAGLRATLSDSMSNFFGYGFEKNAIKLANFLRKGKFASRPIR